ncbi:MAG: hypothetical protein A3G91_03670 [Omnitrophica WOR_2 bacterium RIFCSPLOWO2_12_FULL_50_9]|nr:MAG: hypothetical protein A3D87_05260 [Omnitrophica WOR_2 bacterium RIFCSPHIGHO2_02_FULL_50_17]OGX41713.1 MAG: hypothetical protein A3G91_03670 [Omnitrophica WOR_2 bacterium RIFCSPLOWO2_12_FULL_50_9]
MRFFTRIAVLLYVILVLFLGCFTLLYVSHAVDFKQVFDVLYAAYFDHRLRLIAGSIAAGMLLFNFLFYRLFSINARRERVIAFDNPSGRVSVALDALEELLRRMITKSPEIKEAKVALRASKKGLYVKIRMVLCAEVNIPEITSKVQELSRRKIQDIIGLDEPVNVTVYIGKILPDRVKEKRSSKKEEIEEKSETTIPFQGYRA